MNRSSSLSVVPYKTHKGVHVHAYVCACKWYFFHYAILRVKYVKSTRNKVTFIPQFSVAVNIPR